MSSEVDLFQRYLLLIKMAIKSKRPPLGRAKFKVNRPALITILMKTRARFNEHWTDLQLPADNTTTMATRLPTGLKNQSVYIVVFKIKLLLVLSFLSCGCCCWIPDDITRSNCRYRWSHTTISSSALTKLWHRRRSMRLVVRRETYVLLYGSTVLCTEWSHGQKSIGKKQIQCELSS